MNTAIITGGSSGLGACLMEAMAGSWRLINWSIATGVDVRSSASLYGAVQELNEEDKIDVLINCAGVNEINFLPSLTEEAWNDIMDTNAKGIFLTSRALLERLRGGTILNIVSNASHVPMTSSLAYNASKGAAAIMTRQMARELKKTHDITVFAVSPNKLAGTGMSQYIDSRVCETRGWTPEEARAYQLAALPAGEETDPRVAAEFIAFLLSTKERHKFLNGCDIPYGA